MSLDVYLTAAEPQPVLKGSGIFVRVGGETKEITREEWDRLHPDREPVLFTPMISESCEVYHHNITHNLNKMAEVAGIYKELWRPEELGIEKAAQLIAPLELGLATLKDDPAYFKLFNPLNGWGNYEGLVSFVEEYLEACKNHPDADVEASR